MLGWQEITRLRPVAPDRFDQRLFRYAGRFGPAEVLDLGAFAAPRPRVNRLTLTIYIVSEAETGGVPVIAH